jgi:hypothetical protein
VVWLHAQRASLLRLVMRTELTQSGARAPRAVETSSSALARCVLQRRQRYVRPSRCSANKRPIRGRRRRKKARAQPRVAPRARRERACAAAARGQRGGSRACREQDEEGRGVRRGAAGEPRLRTASSSSARCPLPPGLRGRLHTAADSSAAGSAPRRRAAGRRECHSALNVRSAGAAHSRDAVRGAGAPRSLLNTRCAALPHNFARRRVREGTPLPWQGVHRCL